MSTEAEGSNGNVCQNGKNHENAEFRSKRDSWLEERVHEHRESLLNLPNGYSSGNGFKNLAVFLLVVSSGIEILGSINKYGILIDPAKQLNSFIGSLYYPLWVYSSPHFMAISSLTIEKLLSKGQISEKTGLLAIIIVLLSQLLFSCLTTYFTEGSMGAVIIAQVGCFACILKMVSFHMVNHSYRMKASAAFAERKDVTCKGNSNAVDENLQTKLVSYPDNLTLKGMFEYVYFPTLSYELNFPRRPRIRKMFLFKEVLKGLLAIEIMLCVIQQWIGPVILYSFDQSKVLSFTQIMEIWLKLCMPTILIWVLFFHMYFHSGLNIIGEILRFGDRQFYLDWWNQTTAPRFWRAWNVLVYRWSERHLYTPLRNKGYSQIQASAAIFLVSALFHELLVGVVTKVFGLWVFVTMLTQVPAAIFTTKSFRTRHGNFTVWFYIVLILPINIMLTYRDYCKKYHF